MNQDDDVKMDLISFQELLKEIGGEELEEIYKNYRIDGDIDVENNLE